MFNHNILNWEVENDHFYYSQEYTELLKNTMYPEIVPLGFLSEETISAFEFKFHGKVNMSNPEAYKYHNRVIPTIDGKFSEVYYDKKFGRGVHGNRNAIPWDLNTF